MPAPQEVHCVSAVAPTAVLDVPAGQGVQNRAPDDELYPPAAQALHAGAAGWELKVPLRHTAGALPPCCTAEPGGAGRHMETRAAA